ncbi:hypothetical protein EJK17_07870 [Lactobacillus xujianguonis]|uniref:Uncharacterized protein n=1 Tax=Lactobacillus xujianguonis TaxID=2495899 RepID=A0A437SUD2_9LACO|nr:hypothetical protein EJK17_07870 [Lactobacillus xujianguonis]
MMGIILLVCGLFDIHIDLLIKTSLGVSVAFMTVLVIAELFHVLGAGYFRFHPVIIFEIYTVINLMQIAYEYEPETK